MQVAKNCMVVLSCAVAKSLRWRLNFELQGEKRLVVRLGLKVNRRVPDPLSEAIWKFRVLRAAQHLEHFWRFMFISIFLLPYSPILRSSAKSKFRLPFLLLIGQRLGLLACSTDAVLTLWLSLTKAATCSNSFSRSDRPYLVI